MYSALPCAPPAVSAQLVSIHSAIKMLAERLRVIHGAMGRLGTEGAEGAAYPHSLVRKVSAWARGAWDEAGVARWGQRLVGCRRWGAGAGREGAGLPVPAQAWCAKSVGG